MESEAYEKMQIAQNYYVTIRNSDNKEMIKRIAKNSNFDYQDIENIIDHLFKKKHKFENGQIKLFDPDENIVVALERLITNEYTNQDIILLNHELLELTYMKNKKYNIYEVAHEMANKKYNWEILL